MSISELTKTTITPSLSTKTRTMPYRLTWVPWGPLLRRASGEPSRQLRPGYRPSHHLILRLFPSIVLLPCPPFPRRILSLPDISRVIHIHS